MCCVRNLHAIVGSEDHDSHCQKAWPQGKPCNAEDYPHQILPAMGLLCRFMPLIFQYTNLHIILNSQKKAELEIRFLAKKWMQTYLFDSKGRQMAHQIVHRPLAVA